MSDTTENHALDSIPKHVEAEKEIKPEKHLFKSRSSVLGMFTLLIIVLTIPVSVLLTQQRQDIRQRAAEVTPTPNLLTQIPGAGTISGYVFTDDNKNGERDPSEKPYPNATVTINQELKDSPSPTRNAQSLEITAKTDTSGYFKFKFSEIDPNAVSFSVKLELPQGLKTINTNPVIFRSFTKESREVVEFGLFPLVPLSPLPTATASPTAIVEERVATPTP